MDIKKSFPRFALLAGCLLTAGLLQGCKERDKEMQAFLSSPVTLPARGIRVESGLMSAEPLPDKCVRMVYSFGEGECYPCLVSHVYELCRLFDKEEYTTVILFCPPEEEVEMVLNLLKSAKYDFPVYIPADQEREAFREWSRKVKFNSFLLDKDNVPLFVGDPVRDEEAYFRFKDALDGTR